MPIGDLPPTINILSLAGVEGTSSSVPLASIASDPEGDPVTLTFTPQNANLVTQVNGSNLVYGGANTNVNGTYNLLIRATDQLNRVVEKTIPVNLAQRDDLTGRVKDFMEGSFAATRHPELVISSALQGWVKIDGQTVPIDANGNYVSGKLPHTSHVIERFITNGVDSSLVATDTVVAGDQTYNPIVHTNAGTGLDLALYQAFLIEANFGGSLGRLRGLGFDHASAQRVYLVGKDTLRLGHLFERLTPVMQDGVEQITNERINAELPPDKRIPIYKAPQGESIPIQPNGRPPAGTGWVFKDNNIEK